MALVHVIEDLASAWFFRSVKGQVKKELANSELCFLIPTEHANSYV